ncbi:autotransporter strand-loop-strand O-heptosyltransferase [Paraburkholderia sp. DHOC27]|uniref:autotransporter strand-loop-strand O-heptosyltransferase n=1 Tax=Paraburkholderia sp. DHOC27 TaxID=2303330 RepID=UPI000E3CBEF6|nr:autotransporter strand-loop-strand O-heptosyltransferase [Paraburkholderia sp. DHOC27]RFU48988.1 autotransporter strand-loop-strand O-heptosyltransferase [Paraburkholderia sp. DHOC27]
MSSPLSPSLQRGLPESSFASAGTPAFSGPEGIRYDFNYGCRVQVPVSGWRVVMLDLDTHNIIFDEVLEAGEIAASRRKYFVRFMLEVHDGERVVFSHALNLAHQRVFVRAGQTALGDSLAWLPAVEAFRRQHQCELSIQLPLHLHALFREGYPHLHFVTHDDVALSGQPFYASYFLGVFSPYDERDHQPTDPRASSLQDMASYILGVPAIERRPMLVVADTVRRIEEPYVCIAVQAGSHCKYWNNPNGWPAVVAHLKQQGYRVLCIDRERECRRLGALNAIPAGAEDFTGNLPLQERASLLLHAEFFVGLSSGLSWLAWAVGTPVVMIGGFTHPKTEFHTPWRVVNFHACNGCFNDSSFAFDSGNFHWCPKYEGKPMAYQCSSSITPAFVIRVVETLIAAQRGALLSR